MREWNRCFTALLAAMFLAASSGMSWATEQAQQRRAGRDVRQDTRQGSRHTKQDCRAADQAAHQAARTADGPRHQVLSGEYWQPSILT